MPAVFQNLDPDEQLEKLIVESLYYMKEDELTMRNSGSGASWEMTLSFNWAVHVRRLNVNVNFLETPRNQYADMFVGDGINASVTILRNAKPASDGNGRFVNINEHLEGKMELFALLNFNLDDKNKDVVLPTNETYHNNVYNFLLSTNILYRGKEVIKAPAIKCFPYSGTEIKYDVMKKSRTTGTTGKREYHTIPVRPLPCSVRLPSGSAVLRGLVSMVKLL